MSTHRRTRWTAVIALGLTAAASWVLLMGSQARADPAGVGASGADTNAADETDGSDWWWLLIPFLLILVGLLLIWLFSTFRQRAARPEAVVSEYPDQDAAATAFLPPDEVGPEAATSADVAPTEQAEATISGDMTTDEPSAEVAEVAEVPVAPIRTEAGGDGPSATVSELDEASPPVGPADGPTTGVSDLTMPLSLEELMAEDLSEVMAPPDDAELGIGAAQPASGDGVGSYYRGGDKVPVPLGAHLPLDEPGRGPDGYPVKADASSGTYHVPGSPQFDAVVADIWFASESAAESAHFRRSDAD
ncbi:hypothetical protein GIY30_15520 [Gordonia sp. HNM0687]|uniref:Uncharacterized protein n=1 Tax=Gordonia mangrovi TaxID=2665643 RepID=A0A6L7GSB2_9ACTN|nr:hypothetical protein [Gordonia mangrovi]MXP22750.1 hypothetical protein [Gordonia mangrovi]UVF77065.1 hypothetical protein NWF22_17320 [Gordonia mangrovi]